MNERYAKWEGCSSQDHKKLSRFGVWEDNSLYIVVIDLNARSNMISLFEQELQ
jgi:hypothetical protein